MMYPFQTKEYRDIFKKHFVTDPQAIINIDSTEYEILPDKRAIIMGMKPVLNGQEITDYSEINNPTTELMQSHFSELKKKGVVSVQYDYVRMDSQLYTALSELSQSPPVQSEVSPFITLPQTWEEYITSLERTDRKELKRKFKRLDTVPHEFRIEDCTETSPAFENFIKLHKLSDSSKDQFMSNEMKLFFSELYSTSIPFWKIKLAFLVIENKPAASLIYFENEEQILLYNSGYDPEKKYYSAGLLLCAHLIKKAIEDKKIIFDFLRGNERYKYDLGAKDMPLYTFIFHFTNSTSF